MGLLPNSRTLEGRLENTTYLPLINFMKLSVILPPLYCFTWQPRLQNRTLSLKDKKKIAFQGKVEILSGCSANNLR